MTPEQVCPSYVQEPRLTLALREPLARPRALVPVDLVVGYAGAGAWAVQLPLELLVVAPTPEASERRVLGRFAPRHLAFIPRTGGTFLVVLRECNHNRWWAAIRLAVLE